MYIILNEVFATCALHLGFFASKYVCSMVCRQERIKATRMEVAKIRLSGGIEVSPLRVWLGGLYLSRSIGDMDVGDYIVVVPHMKEIKVNEQTGSNSREGNFLIGGFFLVGRI